MLQISKRYFNLKYQIYLNIDNTQQTDSNGLNSEQLYRRPVFGGSLDSIVVYIVIFA